MLSSTFVKSFRMALNLSELDFASCLGLSLDEYLVLEGAPLTAQGQNHYRFQKVLCEVAGPEAYINFAKCLEADSLCLMNVVPLDRMNRIELVKMAQVD